MNPNQYSGRRLRKNHSGATPRYIFALDCETKRHPTDRRGKKFAHELRLAVGISGRRTDKGIESKRFHRFRTIEQIWKAIHSLSRSNYTLWIVAHNALFDMVIAGMPEEFEEGRLVPDLPRAKRNQGGEEVGEEPIHAMLSIESPPFIVACRSCQTQGRIVIVDTMNWFPCKLADLGTALGKDKFDMPPFEATDDEWFLYCARDAQIVFDTFVNLIDWVSNNDMGMFRYTGAAQSMAAYRHRFMPHDIYLHNNLPIKCVERSGYFGGRFECFRLGHIRETVHQYDVNSLFPSVMRANKFPVCLDVFDLPIKWTANLPGLDWKASVAEVEIETKHAIYPKRDKRGVMFPIGRFKTTLCGAELYAAYKAGIIRRVRAWGQYRMENIFEDWVESLWAMRQSYKAAGNALYDMFTKSLLNSLYGKFGQRSPQWTTVNADMSALPWSQWVKYNSGTGERVTYRSFGYVVQRRDERDIRHDSEFDVGEWPSHAADMTVGELSSTFVAISAFVTSAARMRMNHIRSVCGERECFYQGVDSLIVTNRGQGRLQANGMISDSTLGLLRLQMTTDEGEILGCSDYRLGDKVVIAGHTRPPAHSPQQAGMQLHLSAKSNLFRGEASHEVEEQLLPWRRVSNYWKGVPQPDGWVEPLEFLGMTIKSSGEDKSSDAAACANSDTILE